MDSIFRLLLFARLQLHCGLHLVIFHVLRHDQVQNHRSEEPYAVWSLEHHDNRSAQPAKALVIAPAAITVCVCASIGHRRDAKVFIELAASVLLWPEAIVELQVPTIEGLAATALEQVWHHRHAKAKAE